jgi:hypothetical protein
MKAAGLAGDVWAWTALDADTKLMVSWLVGGRDAGYATAFMEDIATRLATRVQLTTDGHKAHLEAVEGAFGMDVDFAQLVKLCGDAPEGEKRYSPAQCTGCRREVVTGDPVENHEAAIALYSLYYNFARVYQSLRVTPGDGSGHGRSRLDPGRDRGSTRLAWGGPPEARAAELG